MACTTCRCGRGRSGYDGGDPVKGALCEVLCEIETQVCKGEVSRADRDRVARERAQNSPRVNRAIERRYPGGTANYNRLKYIPMDRSKVPPGNWGRSPIDGAELDNLRRNVRNKLEQASRRMLSETVQRRLRSAWLKFIPVVNVLSTVADAYDIITTAAEAAEMINDAMRTFNNPVFRTRPDVAIDAPGGELGIYDFKFEGDQWNPGQAELYEDAVANSNGPDMSAEDMEVSIDTCECDIADARNSTPLG